MKNRIWKCKCCNRKNDTRYFCVECHCPKQATLDEVVVWLETNRRENPKIPKPESAVYQDYRWWLPINETGECPNCGEQMNIIDSRCPFCSHNLTNEQKEKLYSDHYSQIKKYYLIGLVMLVVIIGFGYWLC